ncbi:MAG: MobA/MobL family protein [Finegoldia magna]|nr:MobA/MobL family protein [Finegoldia magna]MDU2132129.1 MobA/MobL family protein [Finegoldia magna]MDU2220422.1 MobA/MobL family protein [Finegoldia magna]
MKRRILSKVKKRIYLRGKRRKIFQTFAMNMWQKKYRKKVDLRSFKKRGIKLIPTIYLGASVSAMERKGIRTEKEI